MIAPGAVAVGQFTVVTGRQAESNRSRFLQGRGRAYREEIMHLADRVRDGGRRNRPTDSPSGDAVAFREPVDGDRSVAHAVEPREGNVLRSIIKNVLVDFVGDGKHVVFDA